MEVNIQFFNLKKNQLENTMIKTKISNFLVMEEFAHHA